MSRDFPINCVRCEHCRRLVVKNNSIDSIYARALGIRCPNYDCRFDSQKFYDSLEIHKSLAVWYKPWTWFSTCVIRVG